MSNAHLRDKDLSLKAKGLLSQMLSLPTDWDYSVAGLASINREKETSIMSALKELKSSGYLVVTKKMPNETESGRIEYVYDVYEQKQGIEKQDLEILGVEIQGLENQGQLNKEEQSTEVQSKEKLSKAELESEFSEIWKIYPKKQGRQNALSAYMKARKNGTTSEEIRKGLEAYLRYLKAQETEERFIKNGSTWFYQNCWKDEYKASPKNPGGSFYQFAQRDEDADDIERRLLAKRRNAR